MLKAGSMPWLAPLRRLSAGVLLAVFALVLASCSAGSILTDSGSANLEPKGKTVPPVAIQQITGIPPGKLGELRTALAAAGGQHDIGFVEGSFQSGVFSLAGNFRASSGSAGVRLVYQWQFRDGEGVLIENIDGEENAGLYTGPDPWNGVSSAVLDRIARRTAESMARKLSQMGYATRLSSLTAPPAELFAMAAPDAHREVDFDTLHGPGMGEAAAALLAGASQVVEHEEIEPTVASVAPLKGESIMPRVALADTPSAAPPPDVDDGMIPADEPASPPSAAEAEPETKTKTKTAAVSPKPGQKEIRAVAVVAVKGSPGGGDAELTAAMRKTLSAAGWPVVSKPQPDALTIVGRVKVAKKGKSQSVSLNWAVKSPDGKTLGNVKQANEVPAGSLDQGWGPAATAVAEAAATGIFDIVKRYR
jgi:hypothetical protein